MLLTPEGFGSYRPRMNDLLTAADLEALAKAKPISIAEVCRRAGVAESTFWRWKSGATEPTLGIYRRLLDVVRAKDDGGAA